MSTNLLFDHLESDFKIFLLEDATLPSPSQVKVSWISKPGPGGYHEFNVTIVFKAGPVSLDSLERIARRAEARMADVLLYNDPTAGQHRLVLSMPIQWWLYPAGDYGDPRTKELVAAMKEFAVEHIKEDYSAIWSRRCIFEKEFVDESLSEDGEREYAPVKGTGESD